MKFSANQEIDEQWEKYKSHFHNLEVQDNVRSSKEEEYQSGFLNDLFVDILGYTLNPNPNFNLRREVKKLKTDGAILVDDRIIGVIELKGMNTTDLSKVEPQAFGYKNNQPDSRFVIISNFEKLRLYIDHAVDFIEFNLFALSKIEFEKLFLCLAYKNIQQKIPLRIKAESLSREEEVTQKLYEDYSGFKKALFENLLALNPNYDKLTLFKKSQKLLDRFLFIYFGEDRGLLQINSIFKIIERWKKLNELDEYVPLFGQFKKYFNYLDKGHKDKTFDVFAFNGGLFSPDVVLDTVKIDDQVLQKYIKRLSEYDYESEVGVTILGHIFEHSLNEIDEITAEIEGHQIKKKNKRKRDGIFYTPRYITKHIVENTVGKLCENKKVEFAIKEDGYSQKKGRRKKTKEKQLKKLKDYRAWLLQITVVDPACGSGAFLNEALDFLIKEHAFIDELEAKLFGDNIVLSDIENSILEHNLFGVDINEESVEIAKLSLWLRTAKKNRKLNNLNKNLICGNSLIDDPTIAGQKAFNWYKAFPAVFREKDKKAFHVTTALHDSRTSQRMIDYKVREKRAMGTKPHSQVIPLTPGEEYMITETIAEIKEQDELKILAYNICRDHLHLCLVCAPEQLSAIMQKIKAMTARKVNIARGYTKPLSTSESATSEHAHLTHLLHAHSAPPKRGKKQTSLWTQKFGKKPIESEQQLTNTIRYILHNRSKHDLPEHPKKLQKIIDNRILCTYNQAFTPEYEGGFDVVIGNPPYGAKLNKEMQKYLSKHYIKGGGETAISFIKLSSAQLLNNTGYFGFIIPKSFTFSSNYKSIRNDVLNDITEIVDCGKVWKDVKLEQVMFFFQKGNNPGFYKTGTLKNHSVDILGEIPKSYFEDFGFYLNSVSNQELKIAQKMKLANTFINDIAVNTRGGVFQRKISDSGNIKVLGGAEIQRAGIVGVKGYVDKKEIETDEKCFIYKNSVLVQNIVAHILNPTDHIKITACYPDSRDFAIVDTINQITFSDKYDAKVFWLLFNSKLINWYAYRFILGKAIRTIHFDNAVTNKIPIPEAINQQPFVVKAEEMLILNKALYKVSSKMKRSIKREFDLDKFSKKLEKWHSLSYKEFLKELKKKKIKISLAEKANWEDYFMTEKEKAEKLKVKLETLSQEINQMMYALYNLTAEEIEIVEKS